MMHLEYDKLDSQALALSKLLKEKGYDQQFHFLPIDMIAPLEGGLRVMALIWKCTEVSEIPKISLETLSYQDPKMGRINCLFDIGYDPKNGFRVDEMKILNQNTKGLTIDVAHHKISDNNPIPTRSKANESVMPPHTLRKHQTKKEFRI